MWVIIKRKELEEIIEAVERLGTVTDAAEELGLPYYSAAYRYRMAKERLKYNIPEGERLSGTSTLRNKDGETVLSWVKTNKEAEQVRDILHTTAETLSKDIPRVEAVKPPLFVDGDMLSQYTLTDYHIGCYAWSGEGREEWNTKIAEDMLVKWFASAIQSAPNSDTAILAQLGDFLHYDGLAAITPTSGHILDSDVRFQEMVAVAVRAVRKIVEMLLKKHKNVHIIMAEGNHDISSSIWLRVLFQAFYEDEPRVTVDNSALPFYAYEWGKTSLYYHHGHKMKFKELAPNMVANFPELYGRTIYRYGHCGHYHHKEVDGILETKLMVSEMHPTLAARDAHASRGSYFSQRGASVINYHKNLGEVSRSTIRPEVLDGYSNNYGKIT